MLPCRNVTVVVLAAAFAGCGGSIAITVPSAPTGVTATPGNGQGTLSWTAVSGATSYNIYWATTPGVTTATGTKITGVSSPYVQTGLSNGTTYYCVVTAVNSAGESAASSQVSGTPEATTYALSVQDNGNGTVSGGGINCGTTCSAAIAQGAQVTLTATAASGSTFAGWSGACSGTGSTCQVTMAGAETVTATFVSSTTTYYTLTVLTIGIGTGTVTGNGISCPSDCTESVASGTSITLTAVPASGSTFALWEFCDSANGTTCIMSMTANKKVYASFTTGGQGGCDGCLSACQGLSGCCTGCGCICQNACGGSC